MILSARFQSARKVEAEAGGSPAIVSVDDVCSVLLRVTSVLTTFPRCLNVMLVLMSEPSPSLLIVTFVYRMSEVLPTQVSVLITSVVLLIVMSVLTTSIIPLTQLSLLWFSQ